MTERPLADATRISGQPEPTRDDLAQILRLTFERREPEVGQTARISHRDGTLLAEGPYLLDETAGIRPAVRTADGTVRRREIGERLEPVGEVPRRTVAAATAGELAVAAELLEQLAAVYAGEQLGDLAHEVAELFWDAPEA